MVQPLRIARHAAGVGALVIAAASSSLSADNLGQPLRFFDGRTQMISVVKVIMKKPYQTRTTGRGELLPDGSLALVQQVEEDGKPPHERDWRIRRVDVDRFAGTMSDAVGPVLIQRVGAEYRFNFKMRGNLAVEQWLTPAPGGRSARSRMLVRKFGMRVASSEGTIRKL